MLNVPRLEWDKPMQKNFCIPCIFVVGVLNLYVRKTRYVSWNLSGPLKFMSCHGIQNRRIQTPFLTAKFILKDNLSIRKAVSAIHQLEEQEKVRSDFIVVASSEFIPAALNSMTYVTRSFATPNPNFVSDYKPIPQGNGNLDGQTTRLPMSRFEIFDSLFSLRK
jgi:hypothetical protein